MIRWIGWDVELEREAFEKKMTFWNDDNSDGSIDSDEIEIRTELVEPLGKVPIDGGSRLFEYKKKTYKFDRYGLTYEGHAVCVEAYCVLLAAIENAYVVLHMDKDSEGEVKADHIDWSVAFNELTP